MIAKRDSAAVMRRRGGFTLIEVLVTMAIVASITTLVWGSFNQTYRAKQLSEARMTRYRAARVAMDRMIRDVSMIYLSTNNVPGTEQYPRTFIDGIRKTDIDELRFSYFGHQRLYADSKEADTAVVGYFGMRNRDDSRKLDLMRQEARRLQADKFENLPAERDLLCDDVVRLEFSYYDPIKKDWVDTWRTAQADGMPNRLPSRVRIKLVIHDENGVEMSFETQTRVGMIKPVDTSPQQ